MLSEQRRARWRQLFQAYKPLWVLAVVITVAVLAFYVLGCVVYGHAGVPLDILLGIQSPTASYPWVGVPLALLGYLLIPAYIAIIISGAMTRYIAKTMPTLEQVRKEMQEELEEIREWKKNRPAGP